MTARTLEAQAAAETVKAALATLARTAGVPAACETAEAAIAEFRAERRVAGAHGFGYRS
ncbi:hypothetical protein ACW9UR_23930 [Halovulum sp. GXIMD14794]